jgi:hypothetical protein
MKPEAPSGEEADNATTAATAYSHFHYPIYEKFLLGHRQYL